MDTPAAGNYVVQVRARTVGTSIDYDKVVSTPTLNVSSTTLSVIAFDTPTPFPAATGSPITWTARPKGGTAGPLEYTFYRLSYQTNTWTNVQAYGPSSTYTWTPTWADEGQYSLQVWARNAGSTASYEAVRSTLTSFQIQRPSLHLTMVLEYPAYVGFPITWTAHVPDSSATFQYQFWIYSSESGQWSLGRDYASQETFTWVPSSPGTYNMQAWARQAGSTSSYEVYTGVTVTALAAPTITINSLTPTSGAVGQSVTLAGGNFGSTQGTSVVQFNGTNAMVTSWSASSIVAPVPAGATTGPVVVTVNGTASNGRTFTVVPAPTITSLTPSIGYAGDIVVVNGSNFGPGVPTITFNGDSAIVLGTSSSTLTVKVPSAATSGPVIVKANGASSNGAQFAVLQTAVITAVNPKPAIVGQLVTITGSGFGSTQAMSTLTFNDVVAPITSWNDATIQAVVPAIDTALASLALTVNGHRSSPAIIPVSQDSATQSQGAEISSVSTGGIGTVSIWPTDDGHGYNADIGVWSGYFPSSNEPQACTFVYVDIDVHAGGQLAFTYSQRSWGRYNDFLDVYVLTPGTSWDPGTIWTADNSERCWRQDFPSGVQPKIFWFDEAVSHWSEPAAVVVSKEHGFVLPLNDWTNQHVRVVFRQWNDGYGDETQSRVRNLTVRPQLTMHLTINAFLPFDNIQDPNPLGAGTAFEGDGDARTWSENGSSRTSQIMELWNHHLHPTDIFVDGPYDWANLTQQYEEVTSLDGNLKLTDQARNDWV